ncbi:MAG TPA: recombinase family protein [Streptosporangiaceae bacterium]|nr:recombinase family protein [Streptosporangiaceae bacterium]
MAAAASSGGGLAEWAERSARRRAGGQPTGGQAAGRLRFVFYGRVSTEDWQDPVTSRARQREQAEALVRGHGAIVAELFDVGESRAVAWARRPQAAALVAQLADPGRGWDAIVVGEYERAFYGSQYAAMAPLFEHYGVQLWMPETGGRVDYSSEHDEKTMTVLGLSSKREVTRTSIRVRTAMAAQTREQGRYLGGRPPYGYRLADAGPHPNKAHAAWGRRAHRLDPDPAAADVVRWIFAQRLAGHSVARIARALNEAGIPCPSAADPARNPHRSGAVWTLGTVATILSNPRYTGRQVWNRQRTDTVLADPGNVTLGHKNVQRWNLPDGWVISAKPSHPALVSEADFIAAQNVNSARGPAPQARPVLRRYLLAGLIACGVCGRRMESAWSNGKAAYRCRHGRTSAMAPDPARPKNTYVREDKLLPHLPTLHLLLTSPAVRHRRRTRAGTDVTATMSPGKVIRYLHEHEITLTWDPAATALQARGTETAKTITVETS